MPVQVNCQFRLPIPPSQVWTAFKNVSEVAACFPGVTSIQPIDETSCKGVVQVKLGPMQLEFAGQFAFTEVNDAERWAIASAQGQENRGRGRADSTIRLQIEPDTDGGSLTKVQASAELSGTIAQFGRAKSVVQAVAETLIGEFAKNLESTLSARQEVIHTSEPGAPVLAADPGSPHGSNAQFARVAAPANGLKFAFKSIWIWFRGLSRNT